MSDLVEIRFMPAARVAKVPGGTSLFNAAHWIGLAVESTCGGMGTCGKCRVRVLDGRVPVAPADREFLTVGELEAGWRLACEAEISSDVSCHVPAVLDLPRTATSGTGRAVPVEPRVRRVELVLDPPSETDTRSDLQRLRDGLRRQGLKVEIDLETLCDLPSILRRSAFHLTAVLSGADLLALTTAPRHGALCGLAFDVGTTTVVGSLLDLETGDVLAVGSALNGQAVYGGDVISRIAFTMSSRARQKEMQRAIVETLNRIVEQLCRVAEVSPEKIFETVVVGNCTMLHLLLGIEARPISVAPFVPAFRDSLNVPASRVGLDSHPRARLEVFPVIGAYAGADTVAGLHAVGLPRQEGVWLFIDIGTNSEIALGSSAGITTTAAPAGPAFEGSCIRVGMVATTGAIERVVLTDGIELGVVGGGTPRGICGSGLIDAIAQLVAVGLVDATGRLCSRQEAAGHPLAERLVEYDGARGFALADGVVLTQKDIRELQAAKSSVSTGVEILLHDAGLAPADLEAVLLAGSFGSSIDPLNARTIGLVPEVPLERIRFVGNVAMEGAKMGLLSFRERQAAYDLAARVEYLELSTRPDFNDRFVQGLAFPPYSRSPR